MNEDQAAAKNFRSAYYESLGFREKEKCISKLEQQLKEEVIDISSLKNYCIKNTLPALYRPLVWKLLLNAEPHHQDPDTRQYIISQKTEQFQDLKSAVHTICTTSNSGQTRLSSYENLVYMYGIEKGKLGDIKRDVTLRRDLMTIAKPFLDWFENEIDSYYCFVGFETIIDSVHGYTKAMIEDLSMYLMQKENVLYSHLLTLGVLHDIPYKRWFHECFINDLPLTVIEIVWDKLIAGSYTVLMYIAISIILHRKRSLLMSKNGEQVLMLFENLSEDDASLVLKQGLELWEYNGSRLLPNSTAV